QIVDDWRRHVGLDQQAHRHTGHAAAWKLLTLGDAEPIVAARTAYLVGIVRTEDPELARALKDPVGKELVSLPLHGMGRQFALAELAHCTSELLVLFRKRARHECHAYPKCRSKQATASR